MAGYFDLVHYSKLSKLISKNIWTVHEISWVSQSQAKTSQPFEFRHNCQRQGRQRKTMNSCSGYTCRRGTLALPSLSFISPFPGTFIYFRPSPQIGIQGKHMGRPSWECDISWRSSVISGRGPRPKLVLSKCAIFKFYVLFSYLLPLVW